MSQKKCGNKTRKKIGYKLPNSEYGMVVWKNVYYVANRKLRQNKAPQRISIYGEKCQN